MPARIAFAFAVVLAGFAVACSKPDPLYCDEDTPCDDPELSFCDLGGDYPASEGIDHTCIAEPAFELAISDDDAQVRIGGTLELEVTVDRTGDFPGDITITAAGLPDGTSADPLTIPDGATSGTLTIQGGDADPGALASATVTAAAGPIERAADLRLLVLGPAGSLDPTFGTLGVARKPDSEISLEARTVFEMPDRSLVVGGDEQGSVVLVKYAADGVVDTSFGVGGVLRFNFDSVDLPCEYTYFAQQSTGAIVFVGHGDGDADPEVTNYDLVVGRLTADGALDESFAGNGLVADPVGSLSIRPQTVSTGPDDEIVVGGASLYAGGDQLVVVRFTADGERDTSFGASGSFRIDLGTGHSVKAIRVLQDGSMLVTGSRNPDGGGRTPLIIHVTATGALDPLFGEAGVVEGVSGWRTAEFAGDLITAGGGNSGQPAPAAVWRLSATGALIEEFGNAGVLAPVIPGDPPFGEFRDIIEAQDERVAVGHAEIEDDLALIAVKFDPESGQLDSAFADHGTVVIAMNPESEVMDGLALRDTRLVILATPDGPGGFTLVRLFP